MGILVDALEIVMIICFGASWPFNVMKSYKARTANGKSLLFLLFIIIGYVAIISSKIIKYSMESADFIKWLGFAFYIINNLMVITDLCIYFRNRKLDAERETQKQ